jgi:predicted transcriptional regulator
MILTALRGASTLAEMVVHLKPETKSRLKELATTTGRAPDELVEDAMAGYVAELANVRGTLDERYDNIGSAGPTSRGLRGVQAAAPGERK